MADAPHFVTLGMFIIDEFSFCDEDGRPTGQTVPTQIGGGGTYAVMGARIWLPPHKLGMIVDRGDDFPQDMLERLLSYGREMWLFRERDDDHGTTRALNLYRGDHRGFEYLTPRIRLLPRDLLGTRLAWPSVIHCVCSPKRALDVISGVEQVEGWSPTIIYEPNPDRCVPEELPSLIKVLPSISVLSPNAEEALALLGILSPVTREAVQVAADRFLELGVGKNGSGCVIIRSGAHGAYIASKTDGGLWVDAFWQGGDKVVDVTGAGNGFLGGLAAGLALAGPDLYQAMLYGAVSASFMIEQRGLPVLAVDRETGVETWNNDIPQRRLDTLRERHNTG